MQPVPISQVDRRHTHPTPAIIAAVIVANGLAPELANLSRTAVAEADVDQEVAVLESGLEIGRGSVRGPFVDARS